MARRRPSHGRRPIRDAVAALALFAVVALLLVRAAGSASGRFAAPHDEQTAVAPHPSQGPATRLGPAPRLCPNTTADHCVADAHDGPIDRKHNAPPIAPAGAIASSPHVVLGIPTDSDPSDDVLLDQRQYVVSYNPLRNGPNWVSWELNREHLGATPRDKQFRADPLLPSTFRHIEPRDYAHTGYDRGHLCPSADRSRDPWANSTTFVMTNVLPELHELNAGPWERLEQYERQAASRPDAELAIVAGGIFAPPMRHIGPGIAVPSAFYKVITFLKKGQTASELTPDTEVLAVIMPNQPGVGRQPWSDFVTSVGDVERQSGYELFASLPPAVRHQLEARPANPTTLTRR